MPVPTSITDCNATAANNSPAGSDSIGTSLDDYLRSHAAILRQVYDASLIPTGTRMPFAQASAPTGWTQDTSDNADNRMLRVVKTAGNSVAGSHSPIINNVVPSHTHGMTTGVESANHGHGGSVGDASATHYHGQSDHTHVINTPYGSPGGGSYGVVPITLSGSLNIMNTEAGGSGTNTGNMNATHTHAITTGDNNATHTHTGTTDSGSSQTDWTPRYIDMIICAKN